jgi:hypothetical protein
MELEMERRSRDLSPYLRYCYSNWGPRKNPNYELLQEDLRSIHHIDLATIPKAIVTMKPAEGGEEIEKDSQTA